MKYTLFFLENTSIMFLSAFLLTIKPTPKKNSSLVVLLNNGKIQNAISVSNDTGSSQLNEVGNSVKLKDKKTAISEIEMMSEKEIQRHFSRALEASPQKADIYILYFKSGRMELTKASQGTLTKALDSIKTHKPCVVDIIGHTDTAGSSKGNLRISLKRAHYVKQLIENKNINIHSLVAKGYGEEDLLVHTADNVNEEKNRNVEIFIK